MKEFKLLNEKRNVGVWVTETQLLDLIKITYKRHMKYHKKLIDWYEYLTGEKFKKEYIK